MNLSARSYLTSGVAALGAGVIAIAPLQPTPDHMATAAPQRAVESLAVNLASTINPFEPLVDLVKTTTTNLATAAGYWLQNPLPILQTIAINQTTYLKELVAGNGKVIPGQIGNNLQTFFKAPFSPGATVELDGTTLALGEYVSNTKVVQLGPSTFTKNDIYNTLLQYLAFEDPAALKTLAPILTSLNTHVSSLLLGALGPVLAPFVQLGKSFTAIGDFFKAGDFLGAINEIINIPVKMTNAFLNGGQYLDLTKIVNKIMPLPPQISSIGVELGGLLNLVPNNGSILPGGTAPTVYTGGVGFDGLALSASLGELSATVPGLPIGLTGASLGMNRYVASQMLVPAVLPPNPAAATHSAARAHAPAAAAAVVRASTPAPVSASANSGPRGHRGAG